jgi:hypothetical protein
MVPFCRLEGGAISQVLVLGILGFTCVTSSPSSARQISDTDKPDIKIFLRVLRVPSWFKVFHAFLLPAK